MSVQSALYRLVWYSEQEAVVPLSGDSRVLFRAVVISIVCFGFFEPMWRQRKGFFPREGLVCVSVCVYVWKIHAPNTQAEEHRIRETEAGHTHRKTNTHTQTHTQTRKKAEETHTGRIHEEKSVHTETQTHIHKDMHMHIDAYINKHIVSSRKWSAVCVISAVVLNKVTEAVKYNGLLYSLSVWLG